VIPAVKHIKHAKHALNIISACATVILVSSLNLTLIVPFKMDNEITLGQITILEQDRSATLKIYTVINRQKFINASSRSVVIQHWITAHFQICPKGFVKVRPILSKRNTLMG